MVEDKVKISLNEIADKLELLAKSIRSDSIKLEVIDRGWSGERGGCDFTGTSNFFRERYPELEEFFYTVRDKGISGGYIQD